MSNSRQNKCSRPSFMEDLKKIKISLSRNVNSGKTTTTEIIRELNKPEELVIHLRPLDITFRTLFDRDDVIVNKNDDKKAASSSSSFKCPSCGYTNSLQKKHNNLSNDRNKDKIKHRLNSSPGKLSPLPTLTSLSSRSSSSSSSSFLPSRTLQDRSNKNREKSPKTKGDNYQSRSSYSFKLSRKYVEKSPKQLSHSFKYSQSCDNSNTTKRRLKNLSEKRIFNNEKIKSRFNHTNSSRKNTPLTTTSSSTSYSSSLSRKFLNRNTMRSSKFYKKPSKNNKEDHYRSRSPRYSSRHYEEIRNHTSNVRRERSISSVHHSDRLPPIVNHNQFIVSSPREFRFPHRPILSRSILPVNMYPIQRVFPSSTGNFLRPPIRQFPIKNNY